MADYLEVIYDKKSHPLNSYPNQLIKHLFDRYGMSKGEKILEPGCGRGEFLHAYKKLGMESYGLDLSPRAGEFLQGIEVKQANLDNDPFPYEDNFFDVVYSKSLMEHLHHPDKFLKEVFRILKPGGKVLCLIPDWESNYKIYFDDFTHVSPFTKISLNDILMMSDFTGVNVIKFRQLPIVWKFPILNVFCAMISPFIPVRTKTKFFRWSRELMLIGIGTKSLS
jgi:SAM-dependent methyltransferase